MDKRTRLLTMLLSLTVLVSLTLACSLPGLPSVGDIIPSEEETPAVQPPAEESPAVEPPAEETTAAQPSEEFPFEMDKEGLNKLDSYAYTFRYDGLSTMAGAVDEFELNIEGKRQTSPKIAEHLRFRSTSDGDVDQMEFIYIEELGKMWMREGTDAWQEIPVLDQSMLQIFEAFSMTYWWDSVFAGDPRGARYVGPETVNGVLSHHYRNTESASLGALAAGCTLTSVQEDIWVAVDGSFPMKREASIQANCQGESGTLNFYMEVRDVNQPQGINPPM